MPIYEFQCKQCRRVFEELVRMGSQGEGLACPDCGSGDISKKVSNCYGHTKSSAPAACQFAEQCADTRGGSPGCCGGACHGH